MQSSMLFGANSTTGIATYDESITGGASTISEVPSHTHNITDPGHTHTVTAGTTQYTAENSLQTANFSGYNNGSSAYVTSSGGYPTVTIDSASTGISVLDTGTNITSDVSILNPFVSVYFYIYSGVTQPITSGTCVMYGAGGGTLNWSYLNNILNFNFSGESTFTNTNGGEFLESLSISPSIPYTTLNDDITIQLTSPSPSSLQCLSTTITNSAIIFKVGLPPSPGTTQHCAFDFSY
jgi:hypothetical protein